MSSVISRRGFLKAGLATATAFGFDLRPAAAQVRELKISRTTQTHSICPYCAVGCSVVIHTLGDRAKNVKSTVVHIEGDPDSPINQGTLCPKGISLKQFVVNDQRLTRPLYRAPGATDWQAIAWEECLEKMARRIKGTRDRGFEERDAEGRVVNRLTNLALIGGCTDNNAINYLLGKLRFGLGIVAYATQGQAGLYRPALQSHRRGLRPVRADPSRHRYRLSRGPDPLCSRARSRARGLRPPPHQRLVSDPRWLRFFGRVFLGLGR
jgi:formate dehydrogenase major subunit